MLHVPEDFTEFLYWLKEQTEEFWRQNPRTEPSHSYHYEWPAGIQWIGMSEDEIDRVEATYGVRFTPDHREFLRVLHALDQPYTHVEAATTENTEDRSQEILFYNWLTDEAKIRRRLARPYEDLHEGWLPVLGPKPVTEAERAAGFAQRFSKAPAFLPLMGHRYMVSEPLQPDNLVLSVWGSDIIVYGWNLRSYLLHELSDYLSVASTDPVIEDGEAVDWEDESEIAAFYQPDFSRRIPFYEDYIQTWNGWPPRASEYGPIITS